MKYYIVSEEELERLRNEAVIYGYLYDANDDVLVKAEAACRARQVPDWATHFAGGHYYGHREAVSGFKKQKEILK